MEKDKLPFRAWLGTFFWHYSLGEKKQSILEFALAAHAAIIQREREMLLGLRDHTREGKRDGRAGEIYGQTLSFPTVSPQRHLLPHANLLK